jgi:hypothetical protein
MSEANFLALGAQVWRWADLWWAGTDWRLIADGSEDAIFVPVRSVGEYVEAFGISR